MVFSCGLQCIARAINTVDIGIVIFRQLPYPTCCSLRPSSHSAHFYLVSALSCHPYILSNFEMFLGFQVCDVKCVIIG